MIFWIGAGIAFVAGFLALVLVWSGRKDKCFRWIIELLIAVLSFIGIVVGVIGGIQSNNQAEQIERQIKVLAPRELSEEQKKTLITKLKAISDKRPLEVSKVGNGKEQEHLTAEVLLALFEVGWKFEIVPWKGEPMTGCNVIGRMNRDDMDGSVLPVANVMFAFMQSGIDDARMSFSEDCPEGKILIVVGPKETVLPSRN